MRSPGRKAPEHRLSRKGKVRKELSLTPEALRAAQAILGTATEREPVEATLDPVVFQRELLDGTRALSGLHIDPIR
jgi:hypothetical protein